MSRKQKMKVALITPGFGDPFYCQNCLRDGHGVRALRDQGVDAVHVPIYLPLEQDTVGTERIFFPAVRVYLDSKFPSGRKLFKALSPILDAPSLLSYISKRPATTRARGLGDLTMAMLRGADPFWLDHFFPMLEWLKVDFKPEVVHLSNALLLGFAPALKTHLGCRVVCSLQDEHTWIEDLTPEERKHCMGIMASSARSVDRFLPVSRTHLKTMEALMGPVAEKSTVVFPGVPKPSGRSPNGNGRVIGFLSRMCPEQGLDVLVEAFLSFLDAHPECDWMLRVTGGHTGGDVPFMKRLHRKIMAHPKGRQVEWAPDLYRKNMEGFFADMDLLVHPSRVAEGYSTPAAEALIRGIPCLLPERGGYPEMVRGLAGATTYGVDSVGSKEKRFLEKALSDFILGNGKRKAGGKAWQNTALSRFTLEPFGRATVGVYRNVTGTGEGKGLSRGIKG